MSAAERDELDDLLERLAAEKAARDESARAAEPTAEDGAEEVPGHRDHGWGVWDLPIGTALANADNTAQYDNPVAKKKTRKKGATERDHYSVLFPGHELRYPEGFPRAQWDEPRVYDEQKPPGRSWTIYNYFTGGYEWHFAPLETAPEDTQREYHPQGLTVAEERAASKARRAAHTGPIGKLPRRESKYNLPPILPR